LGGGQSLSGYDAQFVTLARALGAPLITEDRRLLRAFPGEAMSMQASCRL
jgi:predicted nucleic acid-binding protein